jgi:regulator of replication initiation timing
MMTIEELVKQLRRLDYKTDLDEAAADALERQAKWLEGFVKHSDEMAIALSSEATRGEHLFVENSQLRARIAELEEREADALRGATILAVSLAEKHWPENTDWRPLDETAGVITQINNMCAGLGARIAELEAVHTKKQEWLWAEEITRLREENAQLRGLLKPFVPETQWIDPAIPDTRPIDVMVRAGELRAAKAAIPGKVKDEAACPEPDEAP